MEQRADLTAFLLSLTDESFVHRFAADAAPAGIRAP
jgi:hypothetical protein